MCPHIDANWTDREEGKQEAYEKEEEEKEEEEKIKGGEVAMGSRYHDVHRGRGNKRLLEASSIGEKRRGGGEAAKGFFRGEEAVFEPRRWFTLQLTISLLTALADLLVLSLSFGGLFRGGESQPVSLRERRRSRRKEDEKARGSKPGTSLPDNLLRE